MSSDSEKTKDIHVLQLLTKLVKETDRLVRLADDIDTHATTPQAKAAFNLIGSEVETILSAINSSLDPLFRLYELDPGMRELAAKRKEGADDSFDGTKVTDESYDEEALWADVKENS